MQSHHDVDPLMVPLRSEEILHECPLEVRANRGFVGLRRWLTRYFVICKKDWTLRRYRNATEVDAPTRPPRCYKLNDIDYVRADGAPRFIIKQFFAGGEGAEGGGGIAPTGVDNSTVKLGADTSEGMRESFMACFAPLHYPGLYFHPLLPFSQTLVSSNGLSPSFTQLPPSHSLQTQANGCWP